MARRKTAEAEAIPTEETEMQEAATATAVAEPPQDEPLAHRWRTNPFPVKTVNLDGYKVQLQESRPEKSAAPGYQNPRRREWLPGLLLQSLGFRHIRVAGSRGDPMHHPSAFLRRHRNSPALRQSLIKALHSLIDPR